MKKESCLSPLLGLIKLVLCLLTTCANEGRSGKFRRFITSYSTSIMMLFLIGCSATDIQLPSNEVPSASIKHEIHLRTARSHEVICEVQTLEGFYAIATTLPAAVEKQMHLKKSWKQGCPVELADLSYLVLTHWGFDGKVKVGELVVHRKLALPTINAFADLFTDRYPIEKMELIENYDGNDDRSMVANNSSAFNCRDITGKPGIYSKHSYGGAIDINPLQNPYVAPRSTSLKSMGWDNAEGKGDFLRRKGYDTVSPVLSFCTKRPNDCLVLPKIGREYIDRSKIVPGYLHTDSAAVNAFTDRGFDWGGNWSSLLDYQHFEYDNEKLLSK